MLRIKQFILNKIFSPRAAVIDQPGIIYNVLSRKYGPTKSKKRIVFIFEDMFAEIQNEAIVQLGKKRASELFYKIGKDFGVSFILLGGAKKVPSFMLPEVIKFVTDNFRYSGYSIATNVDIDMNPLIVTVSGADNLICRKTSDPSFFAGAAAGIISILSGKNVETISKCSTCPGECRMEIKGVSSQEYIPNKEELMPDKKYNLLNFPQGSNQDNNLESFAKLMKFKKIKISEYGKFSLHGCTIFPAPQQLTCLTMNHFEKIGRKDILEKAIFNSAAKIMNHLIKDSTSLGDKLRAVNSLILSLGWGLPTYQRNGNLIKFYIKYPPFNNFDFSYQSLQLNAFLSSIFKKRLELKEIKSQENPPLLRVTYSL